MPRRFEVLINPESGLQGELVAVIDSGRVRREGESESDTPAVPTISPPVVVDTRTQISAVWDVPDEAIRAGQIEVGLEFPIDVRQEDGDELIEDIGDWLRFQGLEVNLSSVVVEPIVGDDFALRISELPTERVANDTEFEFVIRTTFNENLTGNLPTTATIASFISLSTGSATQVCQIICAQSYRFSAMTPASGDGTITITAVGTGWSVLSADQELGSVLYGTS